MVITIAPNASPLARWLLRCILNMYRYCIIRCQQLKIFLLQFSRYQNNNKSYSSKSTTPRISTEQQRIANRQAWDEFCDTLKAAGAVMFAPGVPQDIDVFTQAEGYRYLSRLARAGLENFVECANVEGIGSDNPDNLYENASIDGSMEYIVTGTRGTVPYLSFGTQTGSYGSKGGLATVHLLQANQLIYDDDGDDRDNHSSDKTFTLYLSAKHPPSSSSCKNWLRLQSNPKEALFIVRQTFGDRRTEIPAKLSIRRVTIISDSHNLTFPSPQLSSSPPAPPLLTPERLDQGLQQAGVFVAGASAMFAKWSWEFKRLHTNELPLFDPERSTKAGGDPNIRYYHSYWNLKDASDEKDSGTPSGRRSTQGQGRRRRRRVLRIKFTPPPQCELWNFQLNNHWMESLDYRYHTIHTNSTLAKPDEQQQQSPKKSKSYTLLVSEQDPNITKKGNGNVIFFRGNWIETVGHTCGTMCFRWINPNVESDDDLPHPAIELLEYENLVGE